jgi:hypothetical protein
MFNEAVRDLAYLNESAEITTVCLAFVLRNVIRSKTKCASFVSPNLLISIVYCYRTSNTSHLTRRLICYWLLLRETGAYCSTVPSVAVQHTAGHVLTTVGRDRPISISLRKQWALCEPLNLRVLLIFLPDAHKAIDKSDWLRRCWLYLEGACLILLYENRLFWRRCVVVSLDSSETFLLNTSDKAIHYLLIHYHLTISAPRYWENLWASRNHTTNKLGNVII